MPVAAHRGSDADGVPRDLTDFFIDEAPVSVGIVLDSSNSMRYKIDDARRVLTDLVAEYQDAAVGQLAQSQLDRLESISAR